MKKEVSLIGGNDRKWRGLRERERGDEEEKKGGKW